MAFRGTAVFGGSSSVISFFQTWRVLLGVAVSELRGLGLFWHVPLRLDWIGIWRVSKLNEFLELFFMFLALIQGTLSCLGGGRGCHVVLEIAFALGVEGGNIQMNANNPRFR